VDFCLKENGRIIPLEVKFQDFKEPKLSRSFVSFLKTYKPPCGLVLTKNYLARTKKGRTQIRFLPSLNCSCCQKDEALLNLKYAED